MTARARGWLVVGGAGLAVAMAVALFGGAPREAGRAPVAAAVEPEPRAPAAPFRGRDVYPSVTAAPEPVAAAEEAAPTGVSPPAPRVPGGNYHVSAYAPPAPRQSASAWINDYRSSVCACTTRECVRELQTRFIHAMASTDYDEARDGQAYAEGARQAVRCLAALPAAS